MRKPLRVLKNQVVNVMLMVALTVPLLVVASTLENKPTLSFEGARIQVAQDGSVQLLFDVCLSGTDMSNGTQFTLSYNPDYLTPSNFTDNKALVWGGRGGKYTAPSKDAFRPVAGLYYGDADGDGMPGDESPFAAMDDKSHIVNWSKSTISVYLLLNNNLSVDTTKNSLISTVKIGDGTGDTMNVFNIPAGKKLILGTLSFRVTEPDLMPEITRRFDGLTNLLFETNHAKDVTGTATDADRLIYFSEKGTQDPGAGVWGIGVCEKRTNDYAHKTINDYDANGTVSSEAQAAFSYRFPKTIIKARAAEAELTLNAYQVYTDGIVSDIDAALQKYSPAITVTYSDGSEGNFIMPWNREANATDSNGAPIVEDAAGNLISNLPWTATVVHDQNATGTTKPVVVDGMAGTDQIEYDPTASRYMTGTTKVNQLYLVEKNFCYEEKDYDNVMQRRTFPIPIAVDLTVIPVVLEDVTANDLTRTYLLNDDLVDEVNAPDRAVQNLSKLHLPNQARLVTDIPVGNGTLTIDIPGWSHPRHHSNGTTSYWPDNTTVESAGIVNLWKDGADETTSVNYHWPTLEDIRNTAENKWNTTEANSALRGTNRAGTYTFQMAKSYGGEPTSFKRPAIQALYPWLTVPDNDEVVVDGNVDKEAWPIDDAKRIIVWNEDPGKKPEDPKQVDTRKYKVEYISTETDQNNNQPTLTLRVTKMEDNSQDAEHLPDQSEFRVKLPDGTVLGIGPVSDFSDLVDWFTGNDGSYAKNGTRLNDTVRHLAFDLVTNTGDPERGTYGAEREALRRYINLGGWFSVSVKEKGDIVEVDGSGAEQTRTPAPTTTWSDFIPVYVPPRPNYYTENKEYNFIGDNARLYPWPGGLATTVILPPGTYNPVTITGGKIVPVYETGTTRKVERYGVSTTYNGETGAQPGELNTFTIDPVPTPDPANDWRKSGPTAIDSHNVTVYGSEYFMNNALYSTYGRVLNLMAPGDPQSYGGNAHTATVRLEEDQIDPEPTEVEKLVLQYVSTNGGAPSYNTDGTNVTEVIFEPRTQGYTVRQDYTLVLRNVGTVDIDGINLDILTDLKGNSVYDKGLDSNPAGGHFEILKPPASFLPAGESTTFVISYVYDLRAQGGGTMEYRDKIFITSNRKDTVPTGSTTAGANYLLDFDAEFQVTNTDIHRVFVNVIPAEKNGVPYPMGTAGVIIGPDTTGSGTGMNKNAGPTAYVKGKTVYILIAPDDEYTKVAVTATDTSGASLTITPTSGYENDKLDSDGHLVYQFVMPDYDTTVTVTFNEPTQSKLRLSDLRVYANADKGKHYPHTDLTGNGGRTEWDSTKADIQRRIWQKAFTDEEQRTAKTYGSGEPLYLMTVGKAAKPDFEDTVPQYLVVLPFEAEYSQIEVDLRAVKYIFDQPNDPIKNVPLENITVQMTLFDTNDVNRMLDGADTAHNHDIYPENYEGNPYAGYYQGKTNGPTTHTSIPFDSPAPGTSKYVRVTLSCLDPDDGITKTRSYYIELHRDTEHVVATLNYGNSPYGMIMNDGAITDKSGAKTTFLNNNYTFNGMASNLTPSVVTAGGLTDLHYWLETWTAPTESWEATSLDADWTNKNSAAGKISVFDPETAMSEALYKQLRKEAPYENDNTNLDLSDYAFFAMMGEEFLDPGLKSVTDSSGRPVDLSKAVLSLEVYTLDNTTTGIDKDAPTGQLGRFALPTDPDELKARTVTIDFLNAADRTKAAVSGNKVTADWATWYRTPTGELTREAAADNTLVELRPGRYLLTYTFPNYNNFPVDPNAPGGTVAPPPDMPDLLTFTRDFVVLAPVGDMNADLSVTTGTTQSDEALLEGRISPNAGYPALGYMSYASDAIFKLRTCDVNNDRNINNIDGNTIGKGTAVQRYYLPIGYKPAGTPAPTPTTTPAPSPAVSTAP